MKRYTIDEFREDYPTNDACLDKLFKLRFANLVCPKCENDKPFTRVKDRRSYCCTTCGFQVYPTKDTVFEKTTTPLIYWFYAIYLQTTTRNGVAAKELERQLNVCYKTALRMAHQIKKLMSSKDIGMFGGIVEMDECAIGGNISNKHNKVRAALIEKGIGNQRWVNKSHVFGMVERNGKAMGVVIPALKTQYTEPIIRKNVEFATKIMTDTSPLYFKLSDEYYHNTVQHNTNEYVRGNVHTNTIEGLWSQLKRTIAGTHIHVSETHLQKYVDEVTFRYNHRKSQDVMFDLILSRI